MIKLAWQLLKRDWRAGELRVLIAALMIAVTSITSIGLFTQRINLAMQDQSGRFLGADLLLRGPKPVDDRFIERARSLGLDTSHNIRFSSVVVFNDQFQLTHIKAVDADYPLQSSISIADRLYGEPHDVQHGPSRGEIWISARLFNALGLSIGDSIELGEAQFKVTAELKNDPGQADNFISIAPRALIHFADVEKTGIIQPGSRLVYQYLFSGARDARTNFEKWLVPQLNPTQKLIGSREGSPALNSALERAESYLSLAAMLSVMLAGIAIAMAANRFSMRHLDQSALMRCMGIQQNQLTRLYTAQLFILGALGSLLGCLIGYLAQQGLIVLLRDMLPPHLPAAPIQPYLIGFISGLITLTGFALPAVLRLKSVPPLRVLRRDVLPMPINGWVVYGLALGSIIVLMWWQSRQLLLTGAVLLGVLAATGILWLFGWLLIRISQRFTDHISGPWLSGLRQLIRHRRASQLQMLAFGLALMVLMIILLLRTDLLSRWQATLPEQAPNHFIINIQPFQVDGIRDMLQQHNIDTEGLYPMVRGRITEINGVAVMETESEQAKQDNALKRELNLSWADSLQPNNKIIDGRWFDANDQGQPVISIETEVAERLGVGLNDTLTFSIADAEITATIISLRSVQWDSFQPNFFVIFPPGVLENYPSSYITSFYLPKGEKTFLNALVKQYPSITIIELDAIMNQVKTILTQVTLAVEYVMAFVLLAGITVLLAALQSSMDERMHNATIIRTLGAKKHYIRKTLLAEFSLLGLFAGLIAVLGTELTAWVLYTRVFDLPFELHGWMWLAGPAAGVLFITLAGYASTRKVMNQSPMKTLREI